MKIVLYDKEQTDILKPVIDAMYEGLKFMNLDVGIKGPETGNYEIAVCWGWRKGLKEFSKGKQVLVMEHGYMIDRNEWISLGWNGLNNNADFLNKDVPNDRWERLFKSYMKPWKTGGEYILLCGQVPGDMSLKRRNLTRWYGEVAQLASRAYKLPVVWRPHPLDKKNRTLTIKNTTMDVGTPLEESLKGAAAIMAFNSNSLINGVMAGVPPIAFDEGTMVWDLAAKNYEPLKRLDREDWGRKMGYTQWNLEEIANGTAIKHIFQKYL